MNKGRDLMDQSIFKKMHVKPHTAGRMFYAPEEYVIMTKFQDYVDFTADHPTFLHLFVTSISEYNKRIVEVLPLVNEETKLWISYKKQTSKEKYDINRDSFFDLATKDGLRPFSNVALDETWSCIGFKKVI